MQSDIYAGSEDNHLLPAYVLPNGHGFYQHDQEDLSTVHSPPEEHLRQHQQEKDFLLDPASYASPPAVKIDGDAEAVVSVQAQSGQPTNLLVSPPTSLVGEAEVSMGHVNEEHRHSLDGDNEVLHTPTSSSRHSSRQPRQVERYVPEQRAKTPRPGPRQTSSGPTKMTAKAFSAPSSVARKTLSRPTSSHKKSASPALERKPVSPSHVKRERTFSNEDADPESLRLIRELQEQEFGLRRRQGRVG